MTPSNRRVFLKTTASLALGSALTAVSGRTSASSNPNTQIRDLLSSGKTSIAGIPLRHRSMLTKIYSGRNFLPLWSKHGQTTETTYAVIKELEKSSLLGLHPSQYYTQVLNSWAQLHSANPPLQLEIVMTDSVIEFFDNLANGQTNQTPGDTEVWFQKQSKTDIEYAAINFFSGDLSFSEAINSIQPTNQNYANLLDALRTYRQILSQGGFTVVAEGSTLQSGDKSPRISSLVQRLAQSGDLASNVSTQPDVYDWQVEESVKQFQQRHGLEADGILGKKTLAVLNVPVEHRIAQIEVNLDRWRWLPRDLGANNIIVNTAGFEMDVMLNHNPALKMNVVVGKPEHRTPIFSDEMEHMTFRPSWNVPKSISRDELLPKELASPGHLDNSNFVVVSRSDQSARPVSSLAQYELEPSYFNRNYRLRQQPGSNNALGSVKFMFPNQYSIYLHDTPAKHLFSETKRAYSHGCVRVQDPNLLARTLLQNEGKDSYEVETILAGKNPQTVKLTNRIPVHLTYQTSWVNEFGEVQFRSDIYGHDQQAISTYHATRPRLAQNERQVLSQQGITTASSDF